MVVLLEDNLVRLYPFAPPLMYIVCFFLAHSCVLLTYAYSAGIRALIYTFYSLSLPSQTPDLSPRAIQKRPGHHRNFLHSISTTIMNIAGLFFFFGQNHTSMSLSKSNAAYTSLNMHVVHKNPDLHTPQLCFLL